MFKNEEWEQMDHIKFTKNVKLHECIFEDKDAFLNFIEQLCQLVGKENVSLDITISNEHCRIKVDSLNSLKKYVNKYKHVYFLDVNALCNRNKSCVNAIEFSFKSFESRKDKTYIKIYSDQESWLNMSESKIISEYLPKKRISAKVFNEKTEGLLYIFTILCVLFKVSSDRANTSNKVISFIDRFTTLNFTMYDYIVVIVSAVAFLFFIQTLREIFLPTIKIKEVKSGRIEKFLSDKMKDTFNVYAVIITIISIIVTIASLFK